jgi:hypothetical protein
MRRIRNTNNRVNKNLGVKEVCNDIAGEVLKDLLTEYCVVGGVNTNILGPRSQSVNIFRTKSFVLESYLLCKRLSPGPRKIRNESPPPHTVSNHLIKLRTGGSSKYGCWIDRQRVIPAPPHMFTTP